jgi:hypothetical protein
VLRLEIDGEWEPQDFIEVLKGVESLYYKAALRRRSRRIPYDPDFYWFDRSYIPASFEEHLNLANDWLLARARATAQAEYRMKVARISYASPGGIDLAGMGQACTAVKGIVDSFIKLYTDRHLRREADAQARIETGMKEESLSAMKIENARRLLELRHDFPDIPEDTFIALIGNDQDRLIPRIAERKLIGVRIIDGEPPKDDEAS